MVEQDYIMRMIHEAVRTLLKLLFNRNESESTVFQNKGKEEKYERLLNLVDLGEINEAENQLLEDFNPSDEKDFEMALLFYSYLNERSNDFLEKHEYSRLEIVEGLNNVAEMCGYTSLMKPFLEGTE